MFYTIIKPCPQNFIKYGDRAGKHARPGQPDDTCIPAWALPSDPPWDRSVGTTVHPLHNSGQCADVRPLSVVSLPHALTLNRDDVTAVSRLQNSRRNVAVETPSLQASRRWTESNGFPRAAVMPPTS